MSEWVLAVIWLGGPFVVGLVATVLLRIRWPKNGRWVAVAGLVLAVGFVVSQYYLSPLSSAPYNGCSNCGNYLGRFWEPQLTIFLAIIGYGLWLLGVGAGIVWTATLRSVRRARRKPELG
jgi:hypothetical protein